MPRLKNGVKSSKKDKTLEDVYRELRLLRKKCIFVELEIESTKARFEKIEDTQDALCKLVSWLVDEVTILKPRPYIPDPEIPLKEEEEDIDPEI